MRKIKIKINNKEIACKEGDNLLEVARKNGIFIPSLCYHTDFKPKANCRICVVEIKGREKLEMSCKTEVYDGMEVRTNTDRVRRARNTNIELIFAEHIEKCPTCIWRVHCDLLDLADRYKLEIKKYSDRKGNRKTYKFANAVEIDGTQCIDCGNCIEACSVLQNINYLKVKGKGYNSEVVPVDDKKIDCIYCGQCAVHCPVGAAQEQSEWEMVENLLNKKNSKKILIAQFAPSIRVSIGEEFGLPYGKIMTDQVTAGLRALGFKYVFDVNFGADITTMVEAEELLKRVKTGGKMPMMTSCCPAWIKYVEFYHPELIPNLTTARSPHIHSGGAVKTYWADKMGINPKDIVVVSIMPCTAKKFEKSRTEMKINGNFPVDHVITTREFAWLMKRNAILFGNLKNSKADNPLGEYSGASALYGGSGGVMESALRTAHALACGNKKTGACKPRIDFKQVRGLEGVKEAEFILGDKKMRIAVVNGIGHIEQVLEKLDKYDYVEVMACPGGCIGGGGQPLPTNDEVRKKRIDALYKLDKSKKMRKAHENKGVLEILEWLKNQKGDLDHKVLHTYYKKRS